MYNVCACCPPISQCLNINFQYIYKKSQYKVQNRSGTASKCKSGVNADEICGLNDGYSCWITVLCTCTYLVTQMQKRQIPQVLKNIEKTVE